MTSHKRGHNNGAVRDNETLILTIDIAADHWGNINLFLSLS